MKIKLVCLFVLSSVFLNSSSMVSEFDFGDGTSRINSDGAMKQNVEEQKEVSKDPNPGQSSFVPRTVPSGRDNERERALWNAIESNNLKGVTTALKQKKVDITKWSECYSPLGLAIGSYSFERRPVSFQIMKLLIDKGAEVDHAEKAPVNPTDKSLVYKSALYKILADLGEKNLLLFPIIHFVQARANVQWG